MHIVLDTSPARDGSAAKTAATGRWVTSGSGRDGGGAKARKQLPGGLLLAGGSQTRCRLKLIDRAKSHAVDDAAYTLGLAMYLQAWVWYKQHRVEEARSEALRGADVFERLGAATALENCRRLLRAQKRNWTVSSCKYCDLLCALTFRSRLGAPTYGADCSVEPRTHGS